MFEYLLDLNGTVKEELISGGVNKFLVNIAVRPLISLIFLFLFLFLFVTIALFVIDFFINFDYISTWDAISFNFFGSMIISAFVVFSSLLYVNNKAEDIYSNMNYSEVVETIYIYSYELDSEVSDLESGAKDCIYGEILQNDIFKFISRKNNGSMYFDDIPYSKSTTDIWEDSSEIPRIEKHTFSKKFAWYDNSYTNYIIYAPKGTIKY